MEDRLRDRIDFGIVAALQKDARLSNKELAAQVGLSPSSCLERVRRLRAAGVLRGFHADVDPGALGFRLEALIAVRLKRHARLIVEAFRAHVLALPQVLALYHLGGRDDFLVHVAVRDTEHLRDLAYSFTTRRDVVHLETSIIFEHSRRLATLADDVQHEAPARRPRPPRPGPR
jgi:DNA-binding Lrp family transcriptional regulator